MKTIDVVWGQNGLLHAKGADVVVIVDVLSFSSAVDAACSSGAYVYPYPWKDARVVDYARSLNATVATQRQDSESGSPSLSPPSLISLPAGYRLVLPSPNGSTLAAMSIATTTIAGCLRNAQAVARYVNATQGSVVVVAAGERWPDGSLRPALEDLIGAGAIVDQLTGTCSEDALASVSVFKERGQNIWSTLRKIPSGIELVDRGFSTDVDFAAQFNSSICVPVLDNGYFQAHNASA